MRRSNNSKRTYKRLKIARAGMDDGGLRLALDPKARDGLRRVLIRDQADRDAITSDLMRYRDERGDDWADPVDQLSAVGAG
jgi:hypothetical protein